MLEVCVCFWTNLCLCVSSVSCMICVVALMIFFFSSFLRACASVSDGEHTTPELDFAVLLLTNHQQPPVFQVLDPLLEVSLRGQAAIGKII